MRSNNLKRIIKHMPAIYAYCQHFQRRKMIRTAKKRKKLTWEEKKKLVEKTYLARIGHPLDWNNLNTYTEKMQWAKMYENDSRKALLADKFAVREWVAKKIGDEHLIPLLGVWNGFSEIDFSKLPDQFVLKTNNGSGTNLIVKDKQKLNMRQVRCLVKDWLDMDFSYYNPFEFQYASIPPQIIAEQFMMTDNGGDLPDYKFLCFDGKPVYCWVDVNRYSNHKRNIYDMNWKLQSWNQLDYGNCSEAISCPKCFNEMVRIATVLAEGFSHVRVDLYEINGKIFFGEMTFTNGSGFEKIIPETADLMLGNLWDINTNNHDNAYNL